MNSWAQLQVGLAVVPGQPLSINWSFGSLLSITSGELKLSFSVIHPLAGKVLVNNPTLVPISGGYAVNGVQLSAGDSIDLLPLDDVVGSSVYDIHASNQGGGIALQLDMTLQGTDENHNLVNISLTATSGYIVVEDLGMEWDNTPLTSASWKSTYQISGKLVNRCQFAKISPTRLELVELDATDGTERILQISSPGELAPGDSVNTVAANITQDWRWFGTFEPSLSGPTAKQFVYTVDYGYRDQFGNKLPLPEDGRPWYQSGNETVSVTVSQEKLDHQHSADGEFQAMLILIAWAAVLSAAAGAAWEIPVLAAIFAVAAAGVSAAAAVLGIAENGDVNAANDPITPDFHLRTIAAVQSPALPAALNESRRLRTLRNALVLLLTERSAEDAVYVTLPRVLGAALSKDRTAYARQLSHANGVLRTIRTTSAKLKREIQNSSLELDKFISRHHKQLEEARLRVLASGFSAAFREQLLDLGLPNDILMRSEELRSNLLSAPIDRTKQRPLSLTAALDAVATQRIKTGQSVSKMANSFLRQLARKTKRRRGK